MTNQHSNNRGDESATIGVVVMLRKYFGDDTDIALLIQSPKYRFLPERYRVIERKMVSSAAEVIQLVIWLLLKTVGIDISCITGKYFREFIRLHKEADLVLSSCGGPYIGDLYINHEFIHILHMAIPVLLKKKTAFISPSMGPFKKRWMNPFRKWLFKRVGRIIVREPISYGYVTDLGISKEKLSISADACLGHRIKTPKTDPEKNNYIGVTLLDFKHIRSAIKYENEDTYFNSLILTLDSLMDRNANLKIIFFPQLYAKYSDVPFIKLFINQMKRIERTEIFSDSQSGVEQQERIANVRFMTATRYHSAIFSCKMKTPCLCIAYEHKAKGFMNLVGMGDYCIDINDITPELTMEKIELIDKNYASIINTLNDTVPKAVDKAESAARIIKEYFDSAC